MGSANSGRELSFEFVKRVERLLRWSSAQKVASEMGIDVGTALKIRNGKHPKQMARAEYSRCTGCGGLVRMPCQLCSVQRTSLSVVDNVEDEIANGRGERGPALC